jgi:hypothetical protein
VSIGIPQNRTDNRWGSGKGFDNLVPPTPAEAAASLPRWERQGVLGRLVRVDHHAVSAVGRAPARLLSAGRSDIEATTT